MIKQDLSSSRRSFLGGAAALGACSFLPKLSAAVPCSTCETSKPCSNFCGVQIGLITYSFRSMPDGSAEGLLGYLQKCGINSIELMGGPAEQFAAAYAKKNPDADPMAGFEALRKLYNDAGVEIHIAKFGNIGDAKMTDEKIEFYFNATKALGARGITREISDDAAKRLGPIADRHKIMIGFHNHTQITPATYDGDILSHGEYLGINLDVGHYLAGTNECPIKQIEKHRDRILSLHIKDRKKDNGSNMPFGEGDTPVVEILQFMKKNKVTFPADIELEYKVPEDSDAVKEVAKCVEFCKKALA